MFTQRLKNRAVITPTTALSFSDQGCSDASLLGPRSNTLRRTADGQDGIITNIAHLLFTSGPSAIACLIVAIVILSVNGVLRGWANSYICKKLVERRIKKANTSAAVVVVRLIARIVTPILGFDIRPVFRGTGFAVGGNQFFLQAPARLACSFMQIASNYRKTSATFTFAPPYRPFITGAGISQDGQTPDDSTSAINKIVNGWNRFKNKSIFIVSHLENSFIVQYLARAVESLRFLQPTFILPQVEVSR